MVVRAGTSLLPGEDIGCGGYNMTQLRSIRDLFTRLLPGLAWTSCLTSKSLGPHWRDGSQGCRPPWKALRLCAERALNAHFHLAGEMGSWGVELLPLGAQGSNMVGRLIPQEARRQSPSLNPDPPVHTRVRLWVQQVQEGGDVSREVQPTIRSTPGV